jgi:penicillin amidase
MSVGPRPDAAARRRARLRLALGLALAAALVAALVGIAELRARRRLRAAWPVAAGRAVLPGLAAPAAVARDRRGIPHIEAADEADAWRSLGYVHAQDRLAQMIWLARSARGRAAELAGEPALAADREARILGLGRHAEEQARRLDPEARRALAAYAEGVNGRLAEIRAGRAAPPRALADLGAELEAWTPVDSVAVGKLYAWGLAGAPKTQLVLEDLVQHLGGIAAAPFFPENAGIRTAPLGTEVRAPGAPVPRGTALDPLRVASGLWGHGLGSSAWVLGGRHAESGRPLLAADIHLEATVPALYYEAHVRGGALDVAGATIPGLPVFWTGRNPQLAWASTHARAAVADLFVETLDPAQPTRYHDGRRWRPLSVRREVIEVRGEDPVLLDVRETAHGPLVNELVGGGRDPLALAWAGARSGPGVGAFLRVARARSAAELRAALAEHTEPVLAVVYADAAGEAGLQTAGWIPRRTLPTGLVPVPGRAEWYDWSEPVPFEDLPRAALAGGSGWLVAADNPLPGPPGGIEWMWRGGERAERIDALLREATSAGPLDAKRLAAMQGDLRSGGALRLLQDALALAGDPAALGSEAREMAALLAAWDGDAESDSLNAALYHVFLLELTRALFEERVGKDLLERYLALPDVIPAHTVGRIVAGAARGGLDPQGWDAPDRVAEAVRRSLRGVWLHLSVRAGSNRERWRWGRLHPLLFRPLVGGDTSERPLGPFPFSGDGATVSAGGYDPSRPFEARVASLYRLVVDTGERGHALSALAPGPSEHQGHPHRTSGLPRWLEARPSLLFTSPLLVDEVTAERLELEPGP